MPRKKTVKEIHVALGCVLRHTKEGLQVLLVKRVEPELGEIHQRWELPGGKVEPFESPQRTVEREVREETSLEVLLDNRLPPVWAINTQLLDFSQEGDYIVFRRKYGAYKEVVVYVECWKCHLPRNVSADTFSVLDHKIAEIKWFPLKEINLLKLIPGSREFVWYVAKEQGITVERPEKHFFFSYAVFISVNERENRQRYYSINVNIALGKYVVTIEHGRIKGWRRYRYRDFASEHDLYEYLKSLIQKRKQHGYLLVEEKDFIFPSLLTQLPRVSLSDNYYRSIISKCSFQLPLSSFWEMLNGKT